MADNSTARCMALHCTCMTLKTSSYMYEMCTGNGECVDDACLCDEGWTGNGDFLNAKGEDCQVHLGVITFLHILCLVIVCLNFFLSVSHVIPDLLRAFAPGIAPKGGGSKVRPSEVGRPSRKTLITKKTTTTMASTNRNNFHHSQFIQVFKKIETKRSNIVRK